MSFINKLLGHAVKEDPNQVTQQLYSILTKNELVELAFKLVRDQIVFTDRRLILVNTQGITEKKKEYHSIPYPKLLILQ